MAMSVLGMVDRRRAVQDPEHVAAQGEALKLRNRESYSNTSHSLLHSILLKVVVQEWSTHSNLRFLFQYKITSISRYHFKKGKQQ